MQIRLPRQTHHQKWAEKLYRPHTLSGVKRNQFSTIMIDMPGNCQENFVSISFFSTNSGVAKAILLRNKSIRNKGLTRQPLHEHVCFFWKVTSFSRHAAGQSLLDNLWSPKRLYPDQNLHDRLPIFDVSSLEISDRSRHN